MLDKNIGKKLDGRYEIQEIIGVGGMAVVYKAYDCIDDRIVAVKILKEEYLTNEEFLRRFKNESKAVAVLSHPNIVKIYDVSFGDRMQYIVMEYIDGITLKEYIEQQKVLKWKEAVHFTVQILRALQHAHDKGIVHRDIKPQNIMMLEDGTIKVTDFGIARFAHSETRTMTDKAIGSVHYISPEQARGGLTDEKSDIYSVGVMLFEMLTGQLPFDADSAVSVAIMQLQTDPKHPREINENIPEGLEDITLRAMQKDPEQRYQSATEMLKDIDEFKRNPSIHFEYKYFVDDNPTKYVDAINKIKGSDVVPKDNKKKSKTTHFFPVLGGVAAAMMVIALIFIFLILKGMGKPTDIVVPNLVGKSYNDVIADKTITSQFVIHKKNTVYSDTVKAGVITEQSPKNPIKAKRGSTIEVTVSLGGQVGQVPDVTGLTEADAKSQLQASGYNSIVVSKKYSDTTAINLVESTDPPKGSSSPTSTQITIYISLGPNNNLVSVPNVVGKSVNDAKNALTGAGLTPVITYVESDKPKDQVVSQSINQGQSVSRGQSVSIKVSLGSQDINLAINLPANSNYEVKVAIDGKFEDKYTFTTPGGDNIGIKLSGYTGTHQIGIYVNSQLFQMYKGDFSTGKSTLTKDNSSSLANSSQNSDSETSSTY